MYSLVGELCWGLRKFGHLDWQVTSSRDLLMIKIVKDNNVVAWTNLNKTAIRGCTALSLNPEAFTNNRTFEAVKPEKLTRKFIRTIHVPLWELVHVSERKIQKL